jgi:hypothetical protein
VCLHLLVERHHLREVVLELKYTGFASDPHTLIKQLTLIPQYRKVSWKAVSVIEIAWAKCSPQVHVEDEVVVWDVTWCKNVIERHLLNLVCEEQMVLKKKVGLAVDNERKTNLIPELVGWQQVCEIQHVPK